MIKIRYKHARRLLIFWCLFIGLGAVAGSIGMLSDTTGKAMGMDAMLPYFQVLPFSEILFQDFFFSGISLLIVNGITNLTAAGLLFAKKKAGIVLGGIFGITLMLWICIQFYMLPLNFLSTIYFFFGLAQALTGYACFVFYRQETESFNSSDYLGVGKNHSEIVVYFSRLGRTRKVAYSYADKTGAEIIEIKTTERVDGTAGFWWCGRFGMHKWTMPIEPCNVDFSKYDRVTVCTPIWVFSVAAPMRQFLKENRGKIKKINYITVHFNPFKYKKVVNEMDKLSGTVHTDAVDVVCELGKIKKTSKY